MRNLTVQTFIWGQDDIPNDQYKFLEKELIAYVVKGSITFKSKDSTKTANANDIAIIERGLHYFESDNWANVKVILLEVPLATFSNQVYRIELEITPEKLDVVMVKPASKQLGRFFKKVENRILNYGENLIFASTFSEFLKHSYRECNPFSNKILWYRKLDAHLIVAIDHIYSDMSINFDLTSLANNCGTTPSRLNRLFNRHFDISPHKWASIHKIDYAKYCVQNSDLDYCEIGNAVGHLNLLSLIGKYKKQHGKTPLAERRIKKNGEKKKK